MTVLDNNQVVTLAFAKGTLTIDGLGRSEAMMAALAEISGQWDERVGKWRCDALWHARVVERLRRSPFTLEDQIPGLPTIHWPKPSLKTLRDYQDAAVAAWMRTRRGVVEMPTGTGKTEVALAIMYQTSVPTLVVVPVRDLMYQWHDRILNTLGYDAGVIGDNTFNVRPVSVTTYDSACIHMGDLGTKFGLIVFDECHHLPGPIRRDAALMSVAPMRLGLSATPERSDQRHLDLEWLIGPTVHTLALKEVKGTALADYGTVRIPVRLSCEEQARYDKLSEHVRNYMFERRRETPTFGWDNLCKEAGKDPECRRAQQAFYAKRAIEDRAKEKLRVLEDLFRLHAHERVIVFTGSNVMAREISERFLIPCLLNHCGKKERQDILGGFRASEYRAIVANQVLDEGVDIPEAKVAIVVGGQTSPKQAKQRLGRILRKQAEAKAVLYEVVCADTREELRSRERRRSDAYEGTRHRHL